MSKELDTATVFEEAADLLLIRGVCREGGYGEPGGPRCALGAVAEVIGVDATVVLSPEWKAMEEALRPYHLRLIHHLSAVYGSGCVPMWNDGSTDDFEVIDTLRLVAKDLRNEATV